jgi:hypothetical protein
MPGKTSETWQLQGDPHGYVAGNLVALDPAYDARSGRQSCADLLALYAVESGPQLLLRADLAAPGFPQEQRRPLDRPGARLVLLVDEAPGGATKIPGSALEAPVTWERAVVVERDAAGALRTSVQQVEAAAGGALVESAAPSQLAAPARLGERYDMIELALVASLRKVGPAPWARYAAVTLVDGAVEDEIAAASPGDHIANAHNVAFAQHGNQGLTYSTVFRGERAENAAYDGDPNNPDDGFDEILAAHQYYNLPGCFHLAATLQTSAAWHDPTFNTWMASGRAAGWVDPVTSAYAQHMMPFVRHEMNNWAVQIERDMTNLRYGGNAVVAWVPERVWLDNPDSDGNGVTCSAGVIDWPGSSFLSNGVQAVLLDDYIHCGHKNNVFDDHHIYTIGTGLKIIPIDNNFVGEVNNDWGSAWNRIVGSSGDELIVYGNDWEMAAEVSQGASNAFALNNYVKILQLCSQNNATVSVWRLSDAIAGFGGGSISLQNGTYGLLGGYGGYGGGNNSWYTDWAAYTGTDNLDAHTPSKWNYGTIWNNSITKLLAAPNNSLSQSAWYVMMTNLHETGWHDNGQVSGWEHHYTNHIKNANVFTEVSRWAAGLYVNSTGAYLSDIDDDGTQEGVIYNDRVFAVFETIGGKAQWVFAKGPGYSYSVVSNDNAYWADTNGDYNETNHEAALSDVSVLGVDREADLYGLSVVTGSGNTVELELTHPNVEKRVRLTLGQKYLDVVYNVLGSRAYVKCGFTPDLIDLTWNGHAPLQRVYDPDLGAYFGQRNNNTGATAAVITGAAGGVHNLQFAATLLEGDEFYGDGAFEVYLFAGSTSPADGTGHIAELKMLRDGLTDVLGPEVASSSYYPTPNRLTLRFNQVVRFDNIVKTKIAIDANNDNVADVTLTNSETIATASNSKSIDINLTTATSNAIEALNHSNLKLLLQSGACTDVVTNTNAAVTASSNKAITYEAATLITIDGRIDPVEWIAKRRLVTDPSSDSQWTSANELKGLYIVWDPTYLYLGVEGQVSGNSWILYLDTDCFGPNGQTDLTAIDAWERGATFTGAGFKPDYEWGTYQHQGAFDSGSLFRITSATTTANLTSQAILALDSQHTFGAQSGSEIAVPWDVLYGLGAGHVPPGTKLGLVVSICWDPEPNGQLGGDVMPNNRSAALPVVDSFVYLPIDNNGDGIPDPNPVPTDVPPFVDLSTLPHVSRLLAARPNPFNPTTRLVYEVAGPAPEQRPTLLTIHDVRGRLMASLVDGPRSPGRHEITWNGTDRNGATLPAGLYLAKLRVGQGPASVARLMLMK